jgi:hypothetical protein
MWLSAETVQRYPNVERGQAMRKPLFGQGWFYKQSGRRLGPVSGSRLKELVSSGELEPGQAVWREANQTLYFVCASTAVLETEKQAAGRGSEDPAAETLINMDTK